MTKSKQLLLIDGSSYFYRAYHALPELKNAKGESTGAVFGVIKMVLKLVGELNPDYVAVVFDAKGKTFRHKMYSQYKANRPPMPSDLREQVEPLNQVMMALGFPVLSMSGVEADDVIGALAVQGAKQNMNVIISTGDKDMAQLVNDKVTLVDTMKNKTMDTQGVVDKFGVKPEQMIDYLALVGDTSDNVPGVSKVGPKTAVKWLQQYNDVNRIIVHASEIKGKVGENLREGIDQLKLSRELVTIKTDIELSSAADTLVCKVPDVEALKKLYTQLGFRSLLKEVSSADGDSAETSARKKTNYEIILDESQLKTWIARLEKAEQMAFDTETTSLDSMQAELVGVSFSIRPGEAAYVPCAHNYEGAPKQISRQKLLSLLKPVLANDRPAKIGQHIKYDINVLSRYDVSINGIKHDTMLESYISNSINRHDLDSMVLKHLGHNTIHFEDVAGKGAKQVTFDQVTLEEAGPYAAEDADLTLELHQVLWKQLSQNSTLCSVYTDIEIPLIKVLARIEQTGVLIDTQLLEKQGKELTALLEQLKQKIYKQAGEEFNIGSPKQLQKILFEKLELPVIKKTPKGQASTSEEVLQELSVDFPLPKLILEFRSYSKLKSTYIDRLPEQVNEKTGRVHTSYHQAVTATGRLSSSNPNLQNIPIRSPQGRRIRKAFIAPSGYKIVAADYSQIELRIMAHLSNDERLLEAFKSGQDIHQATAADVFNLELDQVTADHRRSAKAINFGLIYGMSAFGLAKQLAIPRFQAQEYVDQYFVRYPGVRKFMDNIRDVARAQGFVETLYGRRLYLPEINSKNAMRRQYAERTAINAPMQGTAADFIKRAMISIDNWISRDKVNARMIMQVHDELVFEVEDNILGSFCDRLQQEMSQAGNVKVPLVVDIGIGDSWDEAH